MSYAIEARDGKTVVLRVEHDPVTGQTSVTGYPKMVQQFDRVVASAKASHYHAVEGLLLGPLDVAQWPHVQAAVASWAAIHSNKFHMVATGDQPEWITKQGERQ